MTADEVRQAEFRPLRICVLTVSDTRTKETDKSGALAEERLKAQGHVVLERRIVRDDVAALRACVREWCAQGAVEVIVVSGGTGLAGRDVTPEALEPLLTKRIDGFGELFRQLSFEEIGAATIQSRAFAGLCGHVLLFALPGSTGAVRLALERIIEPQLDLRTRPCNFPLIMPRFSEGRPAPGPLRVELVEGPLRPELGPLPHGTGARVVFEGIVRGDEGGRPIAALDYEHYDGMVEKQLQALAASLHERHGLLALWVAHSRGRVPVGTCSFRLIVTAAHRKEALAAVDEFIDRLKAEVAIWKHVVPLASNDEGNS